MRPSARLGRTEALHSPVPRQSPAVDHDLQLDLVRICSDAVLPDSKCLLQQARMKNYSSTLFSTPDLDVCQARLVYPSEIIGNLPIELPEEHISVPCVIPESEIQAFIGDLRNRETQIVLSRLLIVVFAAIELMHSRLAGEPDETRLLLIRQLAREDKNKRYRHMMDEIVATLGSAKESDEWMKGFGSVCMTIGRAFEFASESLPDYAAVRSTYQQRVEQIRQGSNA